MHKVPLSRDDSNLIAANGPDTRPCCEPSIYSLYWGSRKYEYDTIPYEYLR